MAQRVSLLTVVLLSMTFFSPNLFGQLWRTTSGYEALVEEFGASLTDGTGIVVSQVEAPASNSGYKANPNDSEFLDPDKNFMDLSNLNNINSGHANNVARFFFSNDNSAAPGIIDIFQYEANNWINVVTGFAGGGDPQLQPYAIQNHSWVGAGVPGPTVDAISARVDYMCNESDVLMCVGTSNGSGLPQLLVQGYNTLCVGRIDGGHAFGMTMHYGSGRRKPEIVAAGTQTSWSTPRVASAAAMLRQLAAGTNADVNQQIKSLLLCGATKVEYPSWSRTELMPLDQIYGAGQLNIYNSYKIFLAGETDGQSTIPSNPTGSTGWDHGTIDQSQSMNYLIEVTEPADHISIMLTWNIDVEDSNGGSSFVPDATLSNMDMFFIGNGVFDSSASLNHNIEHIYVRDVEPGLYSITVTTNRSDDFSLSWRTATKNNVAASSINVTEGTVVDGNLLDLQVTDGNYFEIQPIPNTTSNTYEASVEIGGVSSVLMENSLQLDLVASVGSSNIEQRIELFNFVEGEFETIDVSPASFADFEFSNYVQEELYNYVDPDSDEIRVRVSWVQIGPVFQSPWTIRIDKAGFVVSQ